MDEIELERKARLRTRRSVPRPATTERLQLWKSESFLTRPPSLEPIPSLAPSAARPPSTRSPGLFAANAPQLPRNADERDRARFAKAQSYMVRRDDKLACSNVRCRKPFEITQLQSIAFLTD